LADFEGITKEQLEQLAKEYLGSERVVAAKIIPIPAGNSGAQE